MFAGKHVRRNNVVFDAVSRGIALTIFFLFQTTFSLGQYCFIDVVSSPQYRNKTADLVTRVLVLDEEITPSRD